jgi:PDZ domain-containing protein
MRRHITPARLAGVAVVLLGIVVGVLLLTPSSGTYIFLPDKAHPVDPLLTVEGGRSQHDGGGIYYVDVLVRKATLMERLFPSIREGATLIPREALNPPGVSDASRRQSNLREMTRSQQIAAAVALKTLGYKVDATPAGALVEGIFADTPAVGHLRPTDVIVSVDGKHVRTPGDLRRLVSARPPGSTVRLGVRRGDELVQVALRTKADPRDAKRSIVGVAAGQEANIRLPRKVSIDAGDVGGPSAGLAFALDILEELGRDVDRGHKVAVTGEIELDGTVVPIGGVKQKVVGARRTGVDTFVVPAGDNAREARRYADGLRIIPVRNFQQALRALATLPRIDEKEQGFGR